MKPAPPSSGSRDNRPAAVLGIVLAAFAVRAAWREARPKSDRDSEAPVATRLADVVASLPPGRRIAFVDLGGEADGRRRARIDLRLALAPRVLVDEGQPATSFVTWAKDASSLVGRADVRGYAIERTLPGGYVLLRPRTR